MTLSSHPQGKQTPVLQQGCSTPLNAMIALVWETKQRCSPALPSPEWAPAGSWEAALALCSAGGCNRSRLPSLASAGMLASGRNVIPILLQSIPLAWLSISPFSRAVTSVRLVLPPPALGSSDFAQLLLLSSRGSPLQCPIKDFSPRGDVGLGVSSLSGLLVFFKGFQMF